VTATGQQDPTGTFRDAMAELPAGVTVVTAWTRSGDPAGATVSAASSLSLRPPLFLVCLANTSDTQRAIADTGAFLVHVLGDGQQDVAGYFATKLEEKFSLVSWRRGLADLPQLAGCPVLLACDVAGLVPAGDHVIIIGAIRDIETGRTSDPLVYHRRRLRPVSTSADQLHSGGMTEKARSGS
jgi:flavin reductase (DIM6/NTAB) family NADH-FMN oxidoreductase RutF